MKTKLYDYLLMPTVEDAQSDSGTVDPPGNGEGKIQS
jgi:hypothetical protein